MHDVKASISGPWQMRENVVKAEAEEIGSKLSPPGLPVPGKANIFLRTVGSHLQV